MKRATREAETVRGSLSRVRKAYKSRPSLSGLSPEQKLPAKLATKIGSKKGVPPSLLMGLMEVESGFDPTAGSSAGAQGLTQFMPGTAQTHGVQFGASKKAQKSQVKGAANYLKELGVDRDRRNALASYNAGPGNPSAAGDYPETVEAASTKYRQLDKPGKKPKPKDLKIVRKAGVAVKQASTKRPFKSAAKGGSAKIINPKWDPDDDGHGETFLAKGISPAVKKWSKKYNVRVGEAKADSGHVSPGHLVQGTATDVYPADDTEAGWDRLERGLKVLENMGFEVGYGTNGVGQAWANHGRHNHAHIEWVGQGTADDAIKKLAGLTEAQIAKIESGVGSGGTSTSSASSGGSVSDSSGTSKATPSEKKKGLTRKQKLRRVQAAFDTSSEVDSELEHLAKRYGSPAI